MPLLDGVNIFGYAVHVRRARNPRQQQVIAAPGQNGTGSLDQGDRGIVTTIWGKLVGANASLLWSAVSTFEGYQDGQVHTLTDQYGNVWNNVKLERFVPDDRVASDPTYGCSVGYEAEFHHLTPT